MRRLYFWNTVRMQSRICSSSLFCTRYGAKRFTELGCTSDMVPVSALYCLSCSFSSVSSFSVCSGERGSFSVHSRDTWYPLAGCQIMYSVYSFGMWAESHV